MRVQIISELKIPLSLKIVPLEKVVLHEQTDPRRVEKLAQRLAADGRLSNPPMVVDTDNKYVVLDGATRITALKQMDYPHTVVQVVSENDGVSLNTWYHVVRDTSPAQLLKVLNDLPDVSIVESSSKTVLDDMYENRGLCYLHTADDKIYMVQPAFGINRHKALNRLVETYIGAGHITRTLNKNIDDLKNEYADLSTLVVFPKYTVEQVLQFARAGHVLPAGITRFIIPGRVLRLNTDLAYLKSADTPLSEKNEWLYRQLVDRLDKNGVRYYQEPVYLLDE